MASDTLLLLLKLNLAGSAAILAVIALRVAVRGWFGARIAYALWLAVPAALVAVMLPARKVAAAAAAATGGGVFQMPAAGESLAAPLQIEAGLDPSLLIEAAWIAGVILSLAALAMRQAAFTRSLGPLRRESAGVLRCRSTGIGPAIVGAIRPKLVLPLDFELRFDAEEQDLVLTHERVHLRGLDPAINGLAALAQCLNWFNPLAHVAVRLMRIDQELACDAVVLAKFPKARRRYAEALLRAQLAPIDLPFGCYWPARAEHPLKERIAMLKRETPGPRRLVAGAFLSASLAFGLGLAAWAAQPPVPQAVMSSDAKGRALVKAIQRWDVLRAASLMRNGADVDYVLPGRGTPLMEAVRWDIMWTTRQLLDHGADPNIGHGGESPLIIAAKQGNINMMDELVSRGADVNATAPDGATPLGEAMKHGKWRVAEFLKSKGAVM